MNPQERRFNLYNLSHEMLLALTLLEEKSNLLQDESLAETDRQVLNDLQEVGIHILNQYHEPDAFETEEEAEMASRALVELSEEACQKLADFLRVNVQRLFLVAPDSVGHTIFPEAPQAVIRQEDLSFQSFDLFSLTHEQLRELLKISKEYPELHSQIVTVEQCLRILRSPDRAKVMKELTKLNKRTGHVPDREVTRLQLTVLQQNESEYGAGSLGQAYQLKKRRSSH
jgi:hypothetical protein